MLETEAFKALGPFWLVQAALAILILFGGYYVLIRGTREKNGNGGPSHNSIPPWVMMGPAHDVMGAVHDLAEQSRAANEILRTIAHEERQQTQLLEDILNNQVARGDIQPPPTRRKPL